MSIFNLPPPPATSDVTALSWRDWFYKLTIALKTFVASALPAGGTTGQYLKKNSNADQDAGWVTPTAILPSGGTTGQALTKNSNADQDAGWSTISIDLTNYAYLPGRAGGQTLKGGTGTTDLLNLIGTAGNGVTTNAAIALKVGNAGATTAMTVYNDTAISLGSAAKEDPTLFALAANKGIKVNFASPSSDSHCFEATSSRHCFYAQATGVGTGIDVYSDYGNCIVLNQGPYANLSGNASNSAFILYRVFVGDGTYSVSGAPCIRIYDAVAKTDVSDANASAFKYDLSPNFSGVTTLMDFRPRMNDGASAVAYTLDTENNLTNATAKLIALKNAATEKFSITAAGMLNMVVPANYANDAAAAAGGVPVGGVYRNGSVLQIRVT